jgi:LuxR family maltose regulon positive regulatory protein
MNAQEVQTHIASPKRPILQTKLVMPRARANVVARERLLARLNTAVTATNTISPKLTLITAPAGYGKTTLVSQWLGDLRLPIDDLRLSHDPIVNRKSQIVNSHFAWLSLDAGDNDEARFLAYLFAAIATVQEEIGEAALGRLTTTYLYNDTEAILTALLNDIATCGETIVLVLDDYHLITADPVHKAISFILQHMPVQLHLIITSRSEPPLPIALLRARNALNWINARDLRFKLEETAAFLQDTMSVHLSPAQINQLDQQVEGWVTGLQLIAISLQESVAWQQAFSGSQRYLVDYLADQVLDRQPADIQEFLLSTAVLPKFCADLCQHITGLDCQSLLEKVERANLFLIPLDAERQWYRYHHLFADFLIGRLGRHKTAGEIACLHSRAAHWYHEHGESVTAVDHALAAQDFDFAAELMLEVSREVLMFGEGSTLLHWLDQLPPELQSARRRLRLFHAWALLRTGDFNRAEALLEGLSTELDTPLLWGEWSALRARLAVITGDTDVNIRFSQKALVKLPPDQHMLRSEVAINLGFSHLQRADVEAARAAFAEAAQNTAHDPGLWAVMFATFYWGQTYERQTQLKEAFDIYRRGLMMAENGENGRSPSSAVGFMHIGLGSLHYEWNQLAEAESHLRRALACAQRSGDHKMLIYSREALAQLLATLGDEAGAITIIRDLEQQTQADGLSTLRASLAIQRGDLAAAQQWANALNISLDDKAEQICTWPFAYLLLIRLHLAQRNFSNILPALDVLGNFAEERHNTQFGMKVALLRALTYAKQGDSTSAMPCFTYALSLAEPGGFVRCFLDYADGSLARLLHQAAGNGITSVYARTLLIHLDPQQTGDDPVIHPLSPRELEVLRHLANGRANRQIADAMFVSLNTIKAHTRRLYEKLDVSNRTQAVIRARECHLLDE